MNKLKAVRHGEIILAPVKTALTGLIGKVSRHLTFVVGHSESGHHHVLEASNKKIEVTETEKKQLYVELFEPAALVHQKTTDKHRTLTVPAGTYKRYHDTEFDLFEEVIRDVAD